eukprot:1057833-Prymnesium_polylepis.1
MRLPPTFITSSERPWNVYEPIRLGGGWRHHPARSRRPPQSTCPIEQCRPPTRELRSLRSATR